jgi:hypothetical protein
VVTQNFPERLARNLRSGRKSLDPAETHTWAEEPERSRSWDRLVAALHRARSSSFLERMAAQGFLSGSRAPRRACYGYRCAADRNRRPIPFRALAEPTVIYLPPWRSCADSSVRRPPRQAAQPVHGEFLIRRDSRLEQTVAMVSPSEVITRAWVGGGSPDLSPEVLPLSDG